MAMRIRDAIGSRIASTAISPASEPSPVQPRALPRLFASHLLAGLIAATVVISYCISYSVLLFPTSQQGGLSLGLWSLLVGSIVVGSIAGYRTSLPPVSAGPDTPGIAMMSLLSAAVTTQVVGAGGSREQAIPYVLMAFTFATALTGLAMLALGLTRSSRLIRFVPYPVAAGFMGATGLLMAYGSIKLVLGRTEFLAWQELVVAATSSGNTTKLALTLAIAGFLILSRHFVASSLAVPAILIVAVGVLDFLLWRTQLLGSPEGWFAGSMSAATSWSPFSLSYALEADWSLIGRALPEILAIAGVMVVSLLIKISNLEIQRATSGDLDREFTAHGIGNLAGAMVGGIGGGLQSTASRVLEELGSRGRLGGLICALLIALVLLARIDLAALVPTPVLSALLVYLGYTFVLDTLGRPSVGVSWVELGLAGLIMLICLQFGYPAGVLVGIVASCVVFAIRYSRIGIVRRHATRASLSAGVERQPEDTQILRDHGDAIHVYWLTGYLFFGSSDALFERVRTEIEARKQRPLSHLVLDFSSVTGIDMSALKSLTKLTSYCDRQRVTIVYAGLSEQLDAGFERGRFFGGHTRHKAFPTRAEAIEWCEERLIDTIRGTEADGTPAPFEDWLVASLATTDSSQILTYLERRAVPAGTPLYAQGAPSDTIDLVAKGSIAITLTEADGRKLRIRRMARKTVVGEMGFFRSAPRAANVEAATDAVVYTLSRQSFARMQHEQPALAAAFLAFIVRTLSDRLDTANREIATLS